VEGEIKKTDVQSVTVPLAQESFAPGASRRSLLVGSAPYLLPLTLFFFVYAKTISYWTGQVWSDPQYSHIFLIPFISAYIIWSGRGASRALSPQPSLMFGLPVVLFSGTLFLVGRAGSLALLEQASMLTMLVGLILMLLGAAWMKRLVFPIAYLLFTLPLSENLMRPLQWPLQMATAEMSVAALQLLGFPVLLEQNYIILPHIVLEVATVCSGANFLLSILAIGLPLAYLQLSRGWSRIALLLSAIVVGVVANWLRVILISIGAYYEYPVLHGPLHVLQGAFVFWIGLLYLFMVSRLLSKTRYEASGRLGSTPSPPLRQSPDPEKIWGGSRAWVSAGCLSVILAALSAEAAFLGRPITSLSANFETIPKQVGKWIGGQEDTLSSPFRLPGADRELFRRYEQINGSVLHLYVAYFESQRQGKEVVTDQTRTLYDAANPLSIPTLPTTPKGVEAARSEVTVNEVHAFPLFGERRKDKADALFWYEVAGEVFHQPHQAEWRFIRNAILKGKRDGAFFIVWETKSPILSDEQSRASDEKPLHQFLQRLFSSPLSPTRT
jgi:EpsI family protein